MNVAYEAATADLRDFNLIDPFHLEAYGQTAVNYNRDVEVFPVLRRILERITGEAPYQSPTDMGVNRAGFGIVDDAAVRARGEAGVIRRYFRYACEYVMGLVDTETVQRAELLMEELGVGARDRPVVRPRPTPRAGQGHGQGQRRHLLRRGHRAGRRHDRDGEELAADARRVEPGAQRGQAAGRHPRRDPPALALDDRRRGAAQAERPARVRSAWTWRRP